LRAEEIQKRKEENGICPEKHLEIGLETGLGINLGSTV
jgi:hypothetical protein